METPPKVDHDLHQILWNIVEFILKNIFGILSALAGILYQVHQMSGKFKRMSKAQCISSIIMWVIASMAIVIGLADMSMNRLFYGLTCWLTPIVIKPIADAVSIEITPFTTKLIKAIERIIETKIKNKS